MHKDVNGRDMSGGDVFLVQRAPIGGGWVCAPKHMTQLEVQLAVDKRDTVEPYLPDGTGWIVLARHHEEWDLRSPSLCGECSEDRQHWFVAGGLTGVFFCFMSADDGNEFKMEDQEENARTYIQSVTVGEIQGIFSNIPVQ